jgi:hypothetical protein
MGTIVYVDGFDEYSAADAVIHGWSAAFTSMVAGRVAGHAARLSGVLNVSRSVAADAHYTISAAFWFANVATGNDPMIEVTNAGTTQSSLLYNGDGTFSVKGPTGTVLGTSSNCGLSNDVPLALEWDILISDTVGTTELRVNKVVVLGPLSGLDTKAAGAPDATITAVNLHADASYVFNIDDLILTKGGGFQGDLRVVTQLPDGDGANTDWTATTPGPVYVASSTSSGTGAVSLSWPAHIAGDVALLLVEAAGGEVVSLSTAAGFVALANSPQATGAGTAGTRLHAYWCRADSEAMSDPTIADPGDHAYAIMLTFRGCKATGDPVNVTAGGVKTPATTAASSPTATTTVAKCLVISAIARDDDIATAEFSAWTNAGLASIAEISDLGTTSGNGGGIGVAAGILTAAGATGETTATVVSSINASLTIALAPGTGDYGMVDDLYENGDQDYLSSATATDRDTFTFPDVGVVGSVKAVVINHVSRKDDAGTRKIATSVRAGATDYDGTGIEVSTSWAAYQEIREVDPSTTVAWTVGNIDAEEFGIYLDT